MSILTSKTTLPTILLKMWLKSSKYWDSKCSTYCKFQITHLNAKKNIYIHENVDVERQVSATEVRTNYELRIPTLRKFRKKSVYMGAVWEGEPA